MKHLDEVGKRDDNFKQVYQKATFGYGVQQFRKGELKSANRYFTLSAENPEHADYEDAAYFWKGELAYQLHHYRDAVVFSQAFIDKKGNKAAIEHLSPLATVQHAYLNMGYASMEAENYTEAQNYFSKAQEVKSKDTYSGTIAALREADAVFMQKNYARAITLYDKIVTTDKTNADYATYQKAILLGLLGKNSEKIIALQSIINMKPPSGYGNHARYELSVTYLEGDKPALALPYLRYLTDSSNDKSFAPKSWMKTGFVYQQLNDVGKAINAYKHVVADYPAAEERLPAMDALKSLYIQSNQPSAYGQMLRDNNLPSAETNSLDSTYYAAAESQFANGNWEDARTAFSSYLQQYPNGLFAIKARYYRAESNYQLKNYKDAAPDYKEILKGAQNDFYENSARHAAVIAYEDKDYGAAYNYYQKLRKSSLAPRTKELAYNGLMKSGFNAGKFVESGSYADSVLAMPGVSAETMNEALYYKAKTLQHFDSTDAAIKIYKQLGGNKNGDVAAESRYRIAELLLKQDKLKEAEAAANEAIHLSAGYDYWIVKSYILLSDVLVKVKDYFNAKATLESIVKHTKIQELKDEAVKKLDEVKALEKKQTKLSEE
jgi:tetratricopeptide (TPR) repeat protein